MEANLNKIRELWLGFAVSLGAVAAYALMWVGCFKSWYILVPLPGRLGPAMFYALPAFGLAFTMLLLSAVFPVSDPARRNIWFTLFLILEGVGSLFMIWPPWWIKPRWVRWLEREYGYGLHILLEEAWAMGRWRWEVRVCTRLGLEDWAQEVLEERRDDMDEAWRAWVNYQMAHKKMRWRRGKRVDPIEGAKIPYVPRHREREYRESLRAMRAEIARHAQEARDRWQRENEAVSSVIESFGVGEPFTVEDLRRRCPGTTATTVRRVLNALRRERRIECVGRGRAARWRRV